MSELFCYKWDLRGQLADFAVDLEYAAKLDLLGDFTTLLHVTCLPLDGEQAAFSKRELRKLTDVQERCTALLGKAGAFVGRIDVGAQRRLYYYTSDAKLLLALNNFCAKESAFALSCTRVNEPNRQTYYRLLYPNAAKFQGKRNEEFIEIMRSRGDDLASMRRINLHLLFAGAPAMNAFAAEAKTAGFAIGNTGFIPERETPHTLSVHAVSRLEWEELTKLTTEAITIAERCGGTFGYVDSAFVEKRF